MADEAVRDHKVVEQNDLDPELVVRIIDKCYQRNEDMEHVIEDVADILDLSEFHAKKLVRDWQEPDWPVEYTRQFRVNDVDVFEDFKRRYRGYEPGFAREFGTVTATWRINKREDTPVGTKYFVTLVEVNGVDMEDKS